MVIQRSALRARDDAAINQLSVAIDEQDAQSLGSGFFLR
jgi:hypothetical protein